MLDDSEMTEVGQLDDSEKFGNSVSTGAGGNGLRFRQGTTTSSSSDGRKIGPRYPDKPLLPAHNPPPFNFIDDVIPILRPLRSIFKFGRRQVEEIIDDKAATRRQMRKKPKKAIYTGSNIPLEIVFHLSNWIGALQRR